MAGFIDRTGDVKRNSVDVIGMESSMATCALDSVPARDALGIEVRNEGDTDAIWGMESCLGGR